MAENKNKLYLLVEPKLVSYDKVMTEEAVYNFAYELAFESDRDLLEAHKDSNSVTKTGLPYLQTLIIDILEANGYIVRIIEDGIFRLEDYFSFLAEVCPNREKF